MIDRELLRDDGILIVRPKAALGAKDFEALAADVDPFGHATHRQSFCPC